MQPTTQTQVSRLRMDPLNPVPDFSDLANSILLCIKGLVPQKAALLVIGTPGQVANPHGFPVDLLTDLQTKIEADLAFLKNGVNRPARVPRISLADGSFIDAFPMVHAGLLEAVLYLHDRAENGDVPIREKLNVLNPICEVASEAIAHHRAGERADFPADIKDTDISPNLAPLMSSRLMGVIAHDIRTPITVIRGYVKMMLSERTGQLTVEQKECLDGAMNSMDKLNSLAGLIGGASGLMDQIHAEALDLHEDLWKASWREVQLQAREKAIALREQVPDRPFMVCGDRRILCDVIRKLIVRSIGLAADNTELMVNLSDRKNGDVVLTILFSGSSMDPRGEEVVSELLPLVFLHGGKLTFNARNEKGSSFSLVLPGKDA